MLVLDCALGVLLFRANQMLDQANQLGGVFEPPGQCAGREVSEQKQGLNTATMVGMQREPRHRFSVSHNFLVDF